MSVAILILVSVTVVGGLFWRYRSNLRNVRKLEEQYCRRLGLSRAASEDVLKQQLITIRQKHPNHTREWYLKRLISDLDRHRIRR